LPGFETAWAEAPFHGETVSGDALFVETGRAEGGWLFLLVDVMGHGPSTVETMECLRASLGDHESEGLRPAELLRRLNGSLQPAFLAEKDRDRFVCVLAVLIDSSGDKLTGSNAGLPGPRSRSLRGDWAVWKVPGGPPLRILMPGAEYEEATAPLSSGQLLLLFTDGVAEAGEKAHQFQKERMGTVLGELSGEATPGQVVQALLQAVREHVGDNWPDDDTTLLCLSRL
jgi:serine phosphatase RsbU (regulator of sigma subunit)